MTAFASRWLLALWSMIALGALTAAPTFANTRESQLITFDFTSTDTELCGPELPLTHSEVGTFTAADFFDNNGSIIKTLITAHGQLTLTFTNPENGRTTTTLNESQVIKVDYHPDGSPDTLTSTGLVFAFTLPGGGASCSIPGGTSWISIRTRSSSSPAPDSSCRVTSRSSARRSHS